MAQAVPIVEVLLVVLGVALLVLELKAPGSFVFAGLAAVFFLLFFWVQAATGAPLVGVGVGLFLLGMLLVGLELTVLTGHMVAGVLGLLLVLAGLVVAGLDHVPGDATGWQDVGLEGLRTGLTVAGGCVLALIVARHLPDIPVVNRLVLVPPGDRAEPEPDEAGPGAGLLGQAGIAISLIGFAGMARIDGRRVDVVTEGEAIPPGVGVRVVEVDGPRVVVRRA
jgi:membrane-bound serine protease (ClpP class)